MLSRHSPRYSAAAFSDNKAGAIPCSFSVKSIVILQAHEAGAVRGRPKTRHDLTPWLDGSRNCDHCRHNVFDSAKQQINADFVRNFRSDSRTRESRVLKTPAYQRRTLNWGAVVGSVVVVVVIVILSVWWVVA